MSLGLRFYGRFYQKEFMMAHVSSHVGDVIWIWGDWDEKVKISERFMNCEICPTNWETVNFMIHAKFNNSLNDNQITMWRMIHQAPQGSEKDFEGGKCEP